MSKYFVVLLVADICRSKRRSDSTLVLRLNWSQFGPLL